MDKNQKGNNAFPEGNERGKGYEERLEMQVEEILAVLDIDEEIPDGLIEKVMQKKETVKIDKPSGFDALKYIQIAAVLVAGIFVGVLLGKNANIQIFNPKHSREEKALMDLRDKHHLSEDYTFGKL